MLDEPENIDVIEDDIAPEEEFVHAWIYCSKCDRLTNHWADSHDVS